MCDAEKCEEEPIDEAVKQAKYKDFSPCFQSIEKKMLSKIESHWAICKLQFQIFAIVPTLKNICSGMTEIALDMKK